MKAGCSIQIVEMEVEFVFGSVHRQSLYLPLQDLTQGKSKMRLKMKDLYYASKQRLVAVGHLKSRNLNLILDLMIEKQFSILVVSLFLAFELNLQMLGY